MNGKIANVIAVELGILILIGGWLAVASIPGVIPAVDVEKRLGATDSFAPFSRSHPPRGQSSNPVDYLADQNVAQPMPDQEMLPAAPTYAQETAVDSYPADYYQDGEVASGSPPYDNDFMPEPVLTSPDCYGSPYEQVLVYPETTQYMVYSNVQTRRNRPRARSRSARSRPPAMQPRQNRPRKNAGTVGRRGGTVAPRGSNSPRGGVSVPRPKARPPASQPRVSKPAGRAVRTHWDP